MIGAGNYATAVLIPAFQAAAAHLRTVASSTGVTGLHAARKFRFEQTTTDTDALLQDEAIDAVVIATRHDTHADLAIRALRNGKHVFVEKPLALTPEEVEAVAATHAEISSGGVAPLLMVGFNRRFAPYVVRMKSLLSGQAAPKAMIMTVNAGTIPREHWTQDAAAGGGRIIGEACHFIDLLRYIADAPIVSHHVQEMASQTGDTLSISLAFADGSTGTIHYFANGTKSFPKERLEVFSSGRILALDNFRTLSGYGWKGFRKMRLWNQDKGAKACAAAFLEALVEGKGAPIPYEEVIEVARATIEIAEGKRC